ncbi:hypothetical protein FGO68_gene14471 [Halteria grandinella]|uniref:Uncharacterized protein n=1 Tax=Halteria grandinella TaxID=5974 RepID=A0A8J8NUK9_HALGN|nr:hypothetical protein FGO68_gene14471 [Halteria grandinella]
MLMISSRLSDMKRQSYSLLMCSVNSFLVPLSVLVIPLRSFITILRLIFDFLTLQIFSVVITKQRSCTQLNILIFFILSLKSKMAEHLHELGLKGETEVVRRIQGHLTFRV